MAIELQTVDEGAVVRVRATGQLTREDYTRFVPELERFIGAHGKVRVLFDMRDFHGWSAGALWEDVKFDMKHFRDIDRLALVGDRKWEEHMATICRPFTSATVRYFDHAQLASAEAWLAEA